MWLRVGESKKQLERMSRAAVEMAKPAVAGKSLSATAVVQR